MKTVAYRRPQRIKQLRINRYLLLITILGLAGWLASHL